MAVTPNSAIEERRREIEKRRMARKRKRRKAALKRLSVLLCIIAVVTLVILSLTVFFPVEKITVKYTGSHYTKEQIIKASGIKIGENIWMTGSSAEEDIPVKLPFIESVQVERDFPSSIVIKTKPAKAKYCFVTKNDFYVCDKSYKVLEIKKEQNKQLITVNGAGFKKTKAGNKITFNDSKKKDTINKIFSLLEKNSIKLNSIDVAELMDIKIRVDDRFDVELGSTAYLEGKISLLVEMLKESQHDTEGIIKLAEYTPENREAILKKQ